MYMYINICHSLWAAMQNIFNDIIPRDRDLNVFLRCEETSSYCFWWLSYLPRKKEINHNWLASGTSGRQRMLIVGWSSGFFLGSLIIKAHQKKSNVLQSQTHLSYIKSLELSSLTTNLTLPNPPLNFIFCWTWTQINPAQQYCHPEKRKIVAKIPWSRW